MNKFLYVILAAAVLIISCQPSGKKSSSDIADKTRAIDNEGKEVVNKADMTSYFQAALDGDLDKVKEEIEKGVDVNAFDSGNYTALMLAAYNGHHHVLKLLLEKGANIDAVDGMNRTALMFASTGPFKQAVEILVKNGADVNAKDSEEEWTPLMMAAAEGQLEVVKVLIDNGADLTMVDIDGESSLDFAVSKGHTDVVDFIKAALKK